MPRLNSMKYAITSLLNTITSIEINYVLPLFAKIKKKVMTELLLYLLDLTSKVAIITFY